MNKFIERIHGYRWEIEDLSEAEDYIGLCKLRDRIWADAVAVAETMEDPTQMMIAAVRLCGNSPDGHGWDFSQLAVMEGIARAELMKAGKAQPPRPKPGRRKGEKTLNERMRDALMDDPENRRGWEAWQWAHLLKCDPVSIRRLPMWKELAPLREG